MGIVVLNRPRLAAHQQSHVLKSSVSDTEGAVQRRAGIGLTQAQLSGWG